MAVLTTHRALERRMEDAYQLALRYNRKPQGFWLTHAEEAQLRQETENRLMGGVLTWWSKPYRAILVEAESTASGDKTWSAAQLVANYRGVPVYRLDERATMKPGKTPDDDVIAV